MILQCFAVGQETDDLILLRILELGHQRNALVAGSVDQDPLAFAMPLTAVFEPVIDDMRGLRAIYNRAVEKGMTVQREPFKYVYTGIDKTIKRAVPLKVIRQIRDLDLTLFPTMDFARDIFMFSFYTRGMSFIDMAYLKKKDLQGGTLSYRRQKTGQQLFVKWEKPMQEIVDKYNTNGTPYLLPIIRDMNADIRRQYKNAAHLVNDKLKKLGEKLGLTVPLTSYVARHGWASIARSRNIPLAIISEAMGHDSEKTTRIYLASLDTTSVDKANSRILKAL